MIKKVLLGILVILCIVIGYSIYLDSENTTKTSLPSEQKGYYTCPMHPDIRSNEKADCPICGMHLVYVEAPIPTQIKETPTQKGYYTCPMHPDIRSDEKADCPICGMHLVYVEAPVPTQIKETPTQKGYYTCPMHPDIRSDEKADCPICGMHLVYVEAPVPTQASVVASVQLRPRQVDHLRATILPVEEKALIKIVRVLARIIPSEQEESNIPTRIAGRIEKVYVNATGVLIKKGEKLAEIYSPELITAGEEFLVAQKEFQKTKNDIYANLVKQSKEKLLLFGILPRQLSEWTTKGSVPKNIPLYAPFSGIITKRYAVAGKYFQRGAVLYDVVNISSVWVQMPLYEHNMALAKMNQNITLSFIPYPSQTWKTKIDFISSIVSPETQTLELRATLSNKEALLKPNMTGEALLEIPLEKTLVVPERALIRTGKRIIVWVSKSNTLYEAKEVEVGFTAQGLTQVLSGLSKDDMIVDEGAFLLDAQAQLFGGYSQ